MNKNQLKIEYIDNNKTMKEVGEIFGYSQSGIRKLLIKFGIPVRPRYSPAKLDLTGKRFSKLVVLKELTKIERGNVRGTKWLCRCDCGNEVAVRGRLLREGQVKACGCLWKTGLGEITGSYFGGIRTGALKRQLEFNITIEEIWKLFKDQGAMCALSGVPISLSRGEQTASLDRKDSSLGYTLDNIQWVHKDINRMKMQMPDADFIAWAKLIALHNP